MMEYQYLAHYGILGMKWGVRRYQNPDGTLTPLGREHYKKIKERIEPLPIYSTMDPISMFIRERQNAKYYDAVDKLYKDGSLDLPGIKKEIMKEVIELAKEGPDPIERAAAIASYSMESYKKAEKSDVIKKYPHQTDKFGSSIVAGGYWNQDLADAIYKKSGSLYFGEFRSERFKKAYDRSMRTAKREEADKILLDAVLKDLGFKVTQENRDAIEPYVFAD